MSNVFWKVWPKAFRLRFPKCIFASYFLQLLLVISGSWKIISRSLMVISIFCGRTEMLQYVLTDIKNEQARCYKNTKRCFFKRIYKALIQQITRWILISLIPQWSTFPTFVVPRTVSSFRISAKNEGLSNIACYMDRYLEQVPPTCRYLVPGAGTSSLTQVPGTWSRSPT